MLGISPSTAQKGDKERSMSENQTQKWRKLYVDGLPPAEEIVEFKLHGDPRMRCGRFLGNGFWLTNEYEEIGGGRVSHWRPIAEEPVGA